MAYGGVLLTHRGIYLHRQILIKQRSLEMFDTIVGNVKKTGFVTHS